MITTAPQASPTPFDTSIHGCFVDVFDSGVLITGPSGIGKSELALGLINQQHRLIADDCVFFDKSDNNEVIGRCPPMLQDFIEVRGLGVLNIRSMFGDASLQLDKRLDLVIHIEDAKKIPESEDNRLFGMRTTMNILEQEFPKVTLPVAPGRNLAILVEVAVRDQCLVNAGYVASKAFMARQAQWVKGSESHPNESVTKEATNGTSASIQHEKDELE